MTYKTLSFIHALLEKEAQDRYLKYQQARDQYEEEKEGQHRTKELNRLVHLRDDAWDYYTEARHHLEDFEDQDFR